MAGRRKEIVGRLRDAMARTRLDIFDDAADEIEELRAACRAARAAIRDTIRRPLGVEPSTATEALHLIDTALSPEAAPRP